jgi:hypothetical protein
MPAFGAPPTSAVPNERRGGDGTGTGSGTGVGAVVAGMAHGVPELLLFGAHVVTDMEGTNTGGGVAGGGAVLTACAKAADGIATAITSMLKRPTKLTFAILPAENHRKDNAAHTKLQSKPRNP